MHSCLQYPAEVFTSQMATLIYRSTRHREERWTKGRIRSERTGAQNRACTISSYLWSVRSWQNKCNACRQSRAERIRWMNQIHLGRQREVERQKMFVHLYTDYWIHNIQCCSVGFTSEPLSIFLWTQITLNAFIASWDLRTSFTRPLNSSCLHSSSPQKPRS